MPVPPLTLSAKLLLTESSPAGEVQVTLPVTVGITYVIEASDDLSYWTPILTNSAVTGWLLVRDPVAADRRSRFFRVKERTLP